MDSIITITVNKGKSDTTKKLFGITQNGNKVDTSSKTVLVMGPDPYFNNVPKDQWPDGKNVKLTNTELFQSINPLFIVVTDPDICSVFWLFKKKRERTDNSIEIWDGNVHFRFVRFSNGICSNVCTINLYS